MDLKNHPQIIVNPFIIFIGMGLLAVLLQVLLPLTFLPAPTAKIVGIGLMVLNLMIGLPAVRGMLKAKTSPNPNRSTTALILSGSYRFSRNPMYVGLTLLYAGLTTFTQMDWGILLIPILIWLVTVWVIRPEEIYLEDTFGSEYLNYKKTVRRWI